MDDLIRRVDHADAGDRDRLREVYRWAERNPAIYLDGNGYRDAEDFLDPPPRSIEYFVFADGRFAALLTLMPLATVRRCYQVGLITNPDASLRKICKLLRGFMGAVFDRLADALFVDLPDSAAFSRTRKLARFFRFTPVSNTIFLITKREYVQEKRTKTISKPDLDDQLPGRFYVGADDGRGTGAQRVAA